MQKDPLAYLEFRVRNLDLIKSELVPIRLAHIEYFNHRSK